MTQVHQQNIIKQRYQIIEILGKGAMGITYKAQDLETHTNVALKAISLRNLTSAKQLELIEREVEVLQKLNNPHIPRYLDYFEIDTQGDRIFYLIQELIEGKNLDEWVKEGWRVTETEVKEIAEQLLNVLNYLHSLEPPVIHRDIKPHNLLRTEAGKIYLVDFGGVQNSYYTAFHGGSTTVGTFGYMALEQANGKALPASDLYSLGATLLYVLTHRPPEELSNGLSFDFRSQIKLSEEFADWLEKMLEADINERFSRATEALTALKNPKLIVEGRLNPHRKLVWLGLLITILGGVTLFQMNKWSILSSFKPLVEFQLCRNEYITREFFTREKNKYLVKLAADRCLLLGAETGNQKLVKLAIAHGADINTYAYKDEGIRSSVTSIESPSAENFTTNRSFSFPGRTYYTEKTMWGYSTPLERAVWADDQEMVKLLIDHGADPEINLLSIFFVTLDWFKYKASISSPLKLAVYYGRQEMLKFLIFDCANLNIKDSEAITPLLKAAAILKDNSNLSHYEKEKLIYIQHTLNKELVEILIANGADVNFQDNDGNTPLHYAVLGNKKEIIDLLITHGADVNVKNNYNYEKTPLDIAVSLGDEEIINLLKKHGAKE